MRDALLPDLRPPAGIDPAASGILVGFSGGLDSTVLLHLLAAAPQVRTHGLRALHVHHGLQADADAWAAHCRGVCAELGVPLQVVHVAVAREHGGGLEAAARAARHAAFAAELHEGEILALAHHRDDQAETFLLRALRASGPDGLAAMRPWRRHGRGWLWRPLLDLPRSELLAHAQRQGLRWIEDPANADPAQDRNFLRHQVLPLLQRRWPQAGAAFARSAALSAAATDLLQAEDARALAAAATDDPHTLAVAALLALPVARRARVLRRWIEACSLPPLPASGIARIEADLLQAAPDAEAAFAWSNACVRRWRGLLHAGRRQTPLPAGWHCRWDGRAPLALPGGGTLQLEGSHGFDAPLTAHARRGGERIVLPGRRHHHALKHVLQQAGMPPWRRERLPLLSSADGTLLAAGDRILSADFARWLHDRGARLHWRR
ncbi:tRNA lysidine(34) synthetase TilS [Cognatiluteimonas weifangensis]|uniref:tRNA(Ile)-lysidine synthase n=1 Tax=Cognatiluteimonas weifangensis TaxID=2303539 RepID=A0A372DRW7_9GAMM|nr:tRNA lysidine(34) synthetase TilS [Luteimonas weifangensis]RFP62273.1 tRNA lysidine(34) synthetase TilS [Luteimonas weifangensis]